MTWHESDNDLGERSDELRDMEISLNEKIRIVKNCTRSINQIRIGVIGERQPDGTIKHTYIQPLDLAQNKIPESTRKSQKIKLLVNIDKQLKLLKS